MNQSTYKLNELCNGTLEKIKNGIPIYKFGGTTNISAESSGTRYEARTYCEKLKSRLNQIIPFINFLQTNDIDNLNNKLESITNLIDLLNDTPLTDTDKRNQIGQQIYTLIDDIPDISNLSFYFNDNINPKELIHLIKLVSLKHNAFNGLNIEEILNNTNISEIKDITNKFISIHNSHRNSDDQIISSAIISAYKMLEEVSDRIHKEKVSESIEKLEEKSIKIKEAVGIGENTLIFESFKNEAESLTTKIEKYNRLIVGIFIGIISSLLILILAMFFCDHINYIKEIQFYGAYISLFLFLSGLITYFVKERSRLLQHQNYCRITYLELISLIPYTEGIEDENKVNDLKIHLADRYFQGPNQGSDTANKESDDISISKLNEIIKLLQDLKSLK